MRLSCAARPSILGLLAARNGAAAPLSGALAPFVLLEGGAEAEGVAPPQLGLTTRRSDDGPGA